MNIVFRIYKPDQRHVTSRWDIVPITKTELRNGSFHVRTVKTHTS
jgi:hypothetical protein